MEKKSQNMKVDQGASGIQDIRVQYPSNKKEETVSVDEKKVKKVINGNVVSKKKSFGRKLADLFQIEDANSVGAYIFHDVLIPAAKRTLSDIISGGSNMMLFGDTKGSRTTRDGSRSYVSYNKYSDRPSYSDSRRPDADRRKARHNFDDVILETRGEAEEVLSHMVDLTIDYGVASVADLYDLVGITSNYTDNKFGWYDLGRAEVKRVRDGYLLDLPRTTTLD